jgi:RTX calcium-binding nonapeptide repeat (4 copies)
MTRLYILLTMVMVMTLALFAGHEALAMVLTGSGGNDTLVGTDTDDRIKGRVGEDRLKGRGGDDLIKGNHGEDRLDARGGDDRLWGGHGEDTIEGGGGKDKIIPGTGEDEVDAGAGDDLIYARDTGGVDHIDCGDGFDVVETLHRDDKTERNCERVPESGAGTTTGTTSTTTGTTAGTPGTSTAGTVGATGTTIGTTTGTTGTIGTSATDTTDTSIGTTNTTGTATITGMRDAVGPTTGTTSATDTTAGTTETTGTSTTADRVVAVSCGQDLDATVNSDDPTVGTRFQLEGGCTYTVDTVMALNEGDELAGPQATFIERPPAFDPQPTATIVGSEGLSNVIRAKGTVRLEWVKIIGGTGQYLNGSPVAGTGSGLAMGMASDTSSLYAVHITGSDGAGITNAHGTFERIELDDTTNNPDFLGFIGSGLKAITEVEVKNSYIHDNQGNGLWCDVFCHDSASHPNGFWVHENLVVNNGRAGIRFEEVGEVADAGEALIENNEVHGNSTDAVRGGVSIHDAQNALVSNNVFGATTISGIAYLPNSGGVAIRATDSGRSDRPDLLNVDLVGNVLNGELIKGCELPDEVVSCFEAAVPPLPTDTTPPLTTIPVFGP